MDSLCMQKVRAGKQNKDGKDCGCDFVHRIAWRLS
jgi:hypothetical protein